MTRSRNSLIVRKLSIKTIKFQIHNADRVWKIEKYQGDVNVRLWNIIQWWNQYKSINNLKIAKTKNPHISI